MEQRKLLGGRLIVSTGDITRMKVDAIVNAANSTLMGGGGVDGAIHRAGGPAILQECRQLRATRYPQGLPTGGAVATGAGKLPCAHVIHTVGPVWRGGGSGEPEKLASCYRRSLEEAEALSARTVAFPAISTGVYGYPKERAARVAFEATREFLAGRALPQTVQFVFYSEADARVFLQEVSGSSAGTD
jgi:O-acetyl-ADP-ribose deacetylase (regulator of RNase III)